MTKRLMVPQYRLQLIEDGITRLVAEMKRLRSETIEVERKPLEQSDEAKRERAMLRMRKSRASRKARGLPT